MNRVPWQRITLSMLGIAVMFLEWRWATYYLYNIPIPAISAFSSITINSMYVIAALVIFFVTGQIFYNWSNQTTTNIIQEAKSYFEKSEETLTANIDPKYLDDPSIP